MQWLAEIDFADPSSREPKLGAAPVAGHKLRFVSLAAGRYFSPIPLVNPIGA